MIIINFFPSQVTCNKSQCHWYLISELKLLYFKFHRLEIAIKLHRKTKYGGKIIGGEIQ